MVFVQLIMVNWTALVDHTSRGNRDNARDFHKISIYLSATTLTHGEVVRLKSQIQDTSLTATLKL